MLEKEKNNPFRVPENYFEDFHKDLMSRIPENNKAKVVPLWRRIVPWSAVAAVVCGVIFSISYLGTDNKQQLTDSNTGIEGSVQDIYASSYDEDYYLYLEDEVIRESYVDTFFN